jgi:hypothetical protein
MRENAHRGRAHNRRLLVVCAAFACALVIYALWAIFAGPGDPASTGQRRHAHHSESPPPGVTEGRVQYDYDVYDERRLIGVAENVFLGRVLSKIGEKPVKTSIPNDPGRPFAQFHVRVLEPIKASGPRPLKPGDGAVVAQEGGHERGRPYVLVGEACGKEQQDEPLEAGREYLFATYWDGGPGWHVLTAQPAGNRPVEKARREGLLARYREAAVTQVDPLAGEAPAC